ncbi:MAG: hypothetical protein HY519_04705 [Candidatus Aenigmarchaeota archaeon]|nr:hypothetical protein [Candidatus Aenigmarchaeota archaeon]
MEDIAAEFQRILGELSDVRPLAGSMHVPEQVLEMAEAELVFNGRYEIAIPKGYPSGQMEQNGARAFQRPTAGKHENSRLRVGETLLHVRPKGKGNLCSIGIFLLDEAEAAGPAGKGKVIAADELAYVMRHDNGVVSACYTKSGSPFAIAYSWYPKGMEGFGGRPYPTNREEIAETLQHRMRGSDINWERGYKKLPGLVELAIGKRRMG